MERSPTRIAIDTPGWQKLAALRAPQKIQQKPFVKRAFANFCDKNAHLQIFRDIDESIKPFGNLGNAQKKTFFFSGGLPLWQDGLRFRRSFTVPFCRNFLRSLYKDLLEAGGGALPSPHVGAGHLIDQNETRQFQNKHYL